MQNNIGYVSQSIYLAEKVFYLIFLLNPTEKNMDRIGHLIKIMGLKDFIDYKQTV